MAKKILLSVSCYLFAMAFAGIPLIQAGPIEAVDTREEQKIEDQIKELSEEWQRKFVDAVKDFLDQELKRLKSKEGEPVDTLKPQIEKYEETVRHGTQDPEVYFSLGKLYDRMGDGANAIIHTKKAERIFLEQKNVKGMAEARRDLRDYYERYQYKPEDFELVK